MEEHTPTNKQEIIDKLGNYPAHIVRDFDRAWDAISVVFDEDERIAWALAGVSMASMSVRSWEAAQLYYSVSPNVAGMMPFNYFTRWTEAGFSLCQQSPALASSYFSASPGTMARLRSRHIETWARLGGDLYKGTWKSNNLACMFFESSAGLLKDLEIRELERFAGFVGALSRKSYDMALECIPLSQKSFLLIQEDKEEFLDLISSLVEYDWRKVKDFLESSGRALPMVTSTQRVRFIKLLNHLLAVGYSDLPIVTIKVSESLSALNEHDHEPVLDLAEKLANISPEVILDFIPIAPKALSRVSMPQFRRWFKEGITLLNNNPDAGIAYFRLESAQSQEVLENLSSSVEFGNIKDLMEMYCQALAGSEITLSESGQLAEKNIGWVSGETATTEGTTVFVPSNVDRYESKTENFSWYKVVSTHQIAHLEFGSFDFRFDKPSTLFKNMRAVLSSKRVEPLGALPHEVIRELGGTHGIGAQSSDEEAIIGNQTLETDIQKFFNLFDDHTLALDIFTVVEDSRLDARIKREYLGIKAAYSSIQIDAMNGRPEIASLPAREALVEYLVRLSLLHGDGLKVPAKYIDEARKIGTISRRVARPGAEVEDTAEACLRIYAILNRIPNEEIPLEDWVDIDFTDQEYDDNQSDLIEQPSSEISNQNDSDYQTSQDVDYRGEFKPEMVQLLSELRSAKNESDRSGTEITQDMIQEFLESTSELVDRKNSEVDIQDNTKEMASNIMKEAGLSLNASPELGQGPAGHVDEEDGSLDSVEPETFVYDEWDFRAEDYKPKWCIVRQKPLLEGDPHYFGSTLHRYSAEVGQIRRQFEQLVPEMFRKIRRLEDGEEIDIDDVIETMVDIKTGVGASEKLYWKRNKVQRDVAVVFLLDTSASTAEAIDESRKIADDWQAPEDPVEYMAWLRNRRGEGIRRTYKRIIDLEKEAVVLLINALEAVGDVYGIYAFSGYGRENVEFYTVKDIDEVFSDSVKKRIDRISPLHATRMGPAIRHAATKLDVKEAKTKLLFLISDGRPQDRGYSREGVEKEYAVHDTKMALEEAQKKGIKAFCLTVDKGGHDYLQAMMSNNMAYEVLDDIHQLPQRLLYLYKRLTM